MVRSFRLSPHHHRADDDFFGAVRRTHGAARVLLRRHRRCWSERARMVRRVDSQRLRIADATGATKTRALTVRVSPWVRPPRQSVSRVAGRRRGRGVRSGCGAAGLSGHKNTARGRPPRDAARFFVRIASDRNKSELQAVKQKRATASKALSQATHPPSRVIGQRKKRPVREEEDRGGCSPQSPWRAPLQQRACHNDNRTAARPPIGNDIQLLAPLWDSLRRRSWLGPQALVSRWRTYLATFSEASMGYGAPRCGLRASG